MFQPSYRLCCSSTDDPLTVKHCLKPILIKSLKNILCATTYQVCCLLNKNAVSKSDLLYDFSWNICTQLMLLIYELLQTFAWEHIFCTNVDSSCSPGNHRALRHTVFLTAHKLHQTFCTQKPHIRTWKLVFGLGFLQPC